MFDGPFTVRFDPTKREEMNMGDIEIRVGCFVGRKLCDEFGRLDRCWDVGLEKGLAAGDSLELIRQAMEGLR